MGFFSWYNIFMKSLEELNKKRWYRFLKVLYFLVLILTLFSIPIAVGINIFEDLWGGSEWLAVFIAIIIVLSIIECIRRIFYYIYFGTIFPQKNISIKTIKYLFILIPLIPLMLLLLFIFLEKKACSLYNLNNSKKTIEKDPDEIVKNQDIKYKYRNLTKVTESQKSLYNQFRKSGLTPEESIEATQELFKKGSTSNLIREGFYDKKGLYERLNDCL